MAVGDFDALSVCSVPNETDSPLVVEADAVLTGTVAAQASRRFPGGTRRNASSTAASMS